MPRKVPGGPTAVVGALPPKRETVRALLDDPATEKLIVACVADRARFWIAAQPPAIREQINAQMAPGPSWTVDDWVAVLFLAGSLAATLKETADAP